MGITAQRFENIGGGGIDLVDAQQQFSPLAPQHRVIRGYCQGLVDFANGFFVPTTLRLYISQIGTPMVRFRAFGEGFFDGRYGTFAITNPQKRPTKGVIIFGPITQSDGILEHLHRFFVCTGMMEQRP